MYNLFSKLLVTYFNKKKQQQKNRKQEQLFSSQFLPLFNTCWETTTDYNKLGVFVWVKLRDHKAAIFC